MIDYLVTQPVDMDPEQLGRDLRTGPSWDHSGGAFYGNGLRRKAKTAEQAQRKADREPFPERYRQAWMTDPSALPKRPPGR